MKINILKLNVFISALLLSSALNASSVIKDEADQNKLIRKNLGRLNKMLNLSTTNETEQNKQLKLALLKKTVLQIKSSKQVNNFGKHDGMSQKKCDHKINVNEENEIPSNSLHSNNSSDKEIQENLFEEAIKNSQLEDLKSFDNLQECIKQPANVPVTIRQNLNYDEVVSKVIIDSKDDNLTWGECIQKGKVYIPINSAWAEYNDLRRYALPGQGIKLHIGGKIENMGDIFILVAPYLQQKRIVHKIALNEEILRELVDYPTQKGKNITIYPFNDNEAVEIAYALDQILYDGGFRATDFEHSSGEKDIPSSKSGGVTYRYGILAHQEKVYVMNADGSHKTDEYGNYLKHHDNREVYKPSWMTFPTAMSMYLSREDMKQD